MAQERALVLESYEHPDSHKPYVKVKTQRQSACNACEMKSGCGQGLLSKISDGKGLELELENRFGVGPGDIVMLSIPDEGLLSAAVMMFLLPLLALILGAGIGLSLGLTEPFVALIGFVSFALGFVAVNRLSARHAEDPRFQPVMSGIALSGEHTGVCKSAS